ncbi:MAG: TIM barrel protein, partial [Clostridia bacterium]
IDIFEYSFGRGVTLGEKGAKEIGEEFAKNGVEISVHAPYYINFANPDSDMIKKSIGYVVSSITRLKQLGCGERVVVHPATQGKALRERAVKVAKENLLLLIDTIEYNKLNDVKICIETMGKLGQIGTLEEVVDFVNMAPFFYPCIDFGHLNARTLGGIKTKNDYVKIIEYMEDNLPKEKVVNMHVHFSKIMYGQKGEIRHLTFDDGANFGPDYEPLMEVFNDKNLLPRIICESSGTQAEDTLTMKKYYLSLKK